MMALWYDKKAYALLRKCSDNQDLTEWNRYREETNYAPINLRFANIRDFYLKDADLREVDLRGADLHRANYHGADVAHANISISFYWTIFFGAIIVPVLLIFILFMVGIEKDILTNIVNGGLGIVIFVLLFVLLVFDGGRGLLIGVIVGAIGFVGVSISVIGGVSGGVIIGVIIGVMGSILGVVTVKDVIYKLQFFASKSIAYAKNPEEAIGFDRKYLKDIAVPLSIHLEQEITVVKELLKKEQDNKEKQELQNKLEKLEDEKESKLIAEAHAATQQRKIQNALTHILKPYEYIEQNISKLRRHNYFFYGV